MYTTTAVLCLVLTCAQPGLAFISLDSVTPTLRRMANYGYYMMGYKPPYRDPYQDDLEIYQVDGPIWDGHLEVGDFISPIVNAVKDTDLGSMGGYGDERVVKGYDGRLGMRVVVPYLGDFQVMREFGPGRYRPALGPGHYNYPGYQQRPHGSGYGVPKNDPTYATTQPPLKVAYQGLQNYPWYRRKK